jgi:hypothetical protein
MPSPVSEPEPASAPGSQAPPADPKPPSVDPTLQAPAGTPASDDASRWGVLRRRMTELGVARYWVEGEPAGTVRFRCVVPVAGQGAVGQMFQAEADDIPAAAEAALRRIALWRAASPPARPR